MKTHFKISLAVVALATLMAIIAAVEGGAESVVIAFGITCCLAGILSLFISAIFGVARKKETARAFLLSAGITFLLGTGVCSTLLLG